MNYPADLRYTHDHEWLRMEEDGRTATVGITDFAQHELGDIVYVELQPVGTTLAQGAPFGNVEAVKTVSELLMPVSGTIVELNEGLEGQPEAVNTDPYGAGWMVRIEVTDPAEVASLMDADTYAAHAGA